MNITDIKPPDIITHIEQNFNRTQATRVNALIFMALSEDTSVGYQWRSHGFEDIPGQIIVWCGCMEKHDLLELATAIANGLLDEIFPAAIAMEELTPKQLLLARDWIKDCCPGWCDLDKEEVDDLTDTEVTRGVERHFSGGINQFKSNLPEK